MRSKFPAFLMTFWTIALVCAITGCTLGSNSDASSPALGATAQTARIHTPVSSDPKALAPNEVFVPSTTHVLDLATLNNLESILSDGTLVFFNSAPGIANLQPGEILAADTSEKAPNGFLKKVVSLDAHDQRIYIKTEEALLSEAVQAASGSISRQLGAQDVQTTEILYDGIKYLGVSSASGSSAGRSKNARLAATDANPEPLQYRIDTTIGENKQIDLAGKASLVPTLHLAVDINCDETVKKTPGTRVCSQLPGVNLLANMTMKQVATLEVKGNLASTIDQNVELVRHTFKPISLSLGGVPLVVVPTLTVFLQANGSLTSEFNYQYDQDITLGAGFRYNSGEGYEDQSEKDATFAQTATKIDGTLDLNTALGAGWELTFYGQPGAFGSMQSGLHLKGNIAGLETDRNLLWNSDGCSKADVGIDSKTPFTLNYQKQLLAACSQIATGKNHPPSLNLSSPADGSMQAAGALTAYAAVSDEDGGGLTCEWFSDNPSDSISGKGCESVKILLGRSGVRQLGVKVSDMAGATASQTVTINVFQATPTVTGDLSVAITSLVNEQQVDPREIVLLSADVPDGVQPIELTWRVMYPTDAYGNGGNKYNIGGGNDLAWQPSELIGLDSCGASQYGLLTLYAVDANGLSGKTSLVIQFYQGC